jgi:hypothetical protein
MKRTILVFVGAVAAAMLGVAGRAPSGHALAAGPEAAPKQKTAAAPLSAACALVTKAEAEAILGHPLDELTSPLGNSCDYGQKPDKPHIFMTELRVGLTEGSFDSETKNAAKAMGAKIKPATGYGEKALWIGSSQFIVLQHGKAISVSQPGGKKVAPDKLDAFVRKALSRM